MAAEKSVTICNVLGMHVRPSAAVAETAGKFNSTVEIVKDGRTVNAKSSLDLLTLAATQGTELTIRADGPDEGEAIDAIAGMIESGFGEE